MALANVAKINITGHQKDKEDFLEILQNTGYVQIIDHAGDLEKPVLTQEMADIDYKLAGVKFSLDFLSPLDETKKSLVEKVDSKISLSLTEIENIYLKFDINKKVEAVQEVENNINYNKSLIEKLKTELNLIAPWQDIGFVPNKKTNETSFDFIFISTNDNQITTLKDALQTNLPISELQPTGITGEGKNKENLLVLFYKKNDINKVNEILNTQNINTIDLPELDVTIPQRINDIKSSIGTAKSDIATSESEARKLTSDLDNFKIIFDYLTWQKSKLVNEQLSGKTAYTFSISAWTDKDFIKVLEKKLSKVSDDFVIETLDIDEDETTPVIFKNSWAKPFEAVTTMYGAPQKGEPDPTPYLAPFFTLFFGMALTDAGYGIVMALLVWAAIKIFKIPKDNRKMLMVLFWGGVASFILGILSGGWFAIDLNTISPTIAAPLKAMQIINPLENPIAIFYLSLALGVLQVLVGLMVDFTWKLRTKRTKEALTGSGAWIFTIVSLLLLVASSTGYLNNNLADIFKWLTYAGVIGIVLGTASTKKNILIGLPSGIMSLYGFAGYFSDVLSYSRLLALGLTTAIIGLVVNLMAGLVFGIPWIGWFAALVVLVGGHTFNLGINALGAFIHSARLQYIEFFPKFMEGGGQIFQPFQKEFKYIRINNK